MKMENTNLEKTKTLQPYDIKFSVMHIKKLLENITEIHQMNKIYAYIKKFF